LPASYENTRALCSSETTQLLTTCPNEPGFDPQKEKQLQGIVDNAAKYSPRE
jgi:hypothetical protein